MEGLAAVALAGNVLQFIEFALKFTSRVAQIYQKAEDEKANRVQLQNMLNDFILVAAKLESKPTTTPHSGAQNAISRPIAVQAKNEKVEETMRMLAGHSVVLGRYATSAPGSPVERLAQSCKVAADSLLRRLERLRVAEERGSGRIWNSVKAALQEMWKQSELDELVRSLENQKKELEFHVLSSLRESLDLISQRQVDQFEALHLVVKKILQVMQTHQPQVTNQYNDGLASRMSQEPSTTREEIKDAVVEAIKSLGLRDARFNIGLLNSHEVSETYASRYARSLLAEETEILGSLKYPVMLDREDDISTAQKETFSWIFQDPKQDDLPWSNFRAWLNGDDRLYWITGKAGSGKSTLMKYLFCHARTRREILAWATPSQPLVIAGFFFWNTGSPMQKTQQGLFRSLVYQILSHHRELMPLIRNDIGYPAGYNKRSEALSEAVPIPWTNSRLERVFRTLVTQTVKPIKVFLFIDGLDEYSGSHGDITKLLKDISTTRNVKICVSSRPYIAFQNAFGKCPSLILQNLTHRDIKTYVTAKFSEDPQMAELQKREPSTMHLAMEVVDKAAGVFIWVKLVVKSLLEGLSSYDRLSDLKRRLNDLPEDLEDLYWHILKSVKPAFYLEQAAKLLLIAYHAGKPLTLLQLAYTDLEDPDAAGRARFGEFTSEQQVEMAQFTQGRIKTRCLDLLEVPTSSSDADIRYRTVQFMHQSVADFLATTEVKQRLKACLASQPSFNPWGCLMKSSILQLKHLDTVMYSHSNNQPASFLAAMWYHQAWYFIREFTNYAKSMEREKEAAAAIIQLINDLDHSAGHLWQLYLSAECRFLLSDEVHWSEMRSEGVDVHLIRRHGSIQSFALENGLHSYVKATAGLMNKSQVEYALLVDEVLQRGAEEGGDHTRSCRETPYPMSPELRSLLREASKPRVAVGSELVTHLAFWRPDRKYSRDRRVWHIRRSHALKEQGLRDGGITPSGTNVLISRTVFGIE